MPVRVRSAPLESKTQELGRLVPLPSDSVREHPTRQAPKLAGVAQLVERLSCFRVKRRIRFEDKL